MPNLGILGGRIVDMNRVFVSSCDIPYRFQSVLLPGFNDMHVSSTTDYLTRYEASLLQSALWLTIPTPDKLLGPDSRLTFSAGWTAAKRYSSTVNNSNTTSTNGATIITQLQGTAIYIGYSNRSMSGDGGTFTVNVDGIDVATMDTNVSGGMTVSPYTCWPDAMRISGLVDSLHIVTITAHITGGQQVSIDWLSDNHKINSRYPKLFMGNTLRMNAAGYASIGGSGVAVAAYNVINASVASSLVADGLKIHYVDASAAYDPNTEAQADNIHPNDSGHAAIAAAFIAAMN